MGVGGEKEMLVGGEGEGVGAGAGMDGGDELAVVDAVEAKGSEPKLETQRVQLSRLTMPWVGLLPIRWVQPTWLFQV